MAKPKRSRALFEVIHQDKRVARMGGALPTPAWWNKKSLNTATVQASTPPRPVFTLSQRITQSRLGKIFFHRPPAIESPPPPTAAPPVATPFTRTSAAIIAAAVLIVAIVGFAVSRTSRHPSQAQAALAGPPHPDVLDLGVTKPVASLASAITEPAETLAAPAAAVQTAPQRQLGSSYMLIHAYVTTKSAHDTADFLNEHGIPCTVERPVAGVLPQLYAVVGVSEFARPNSDEYVDCVKKIKALLNPGKANGVPLSLHSFKPQLIQWENPQSQTASAG